MRNHRIWRWSEVNKQVDLHFPCDNTTTFQNKKFTIEKEQKSLRENIEELRETSAGEAALPIPREINKNPRALGDLLSCNNPCLYIDFGKRTMVTFIRWNTFFLIVVILEIHLQT